MAPLEGMCSADNSGGVSMVRGHRGPATPPGLGDYLPILFFWG